MCEEMIKLREWLDKHNIEWYDNTDDQLSRTFFQFHGKEVSVIHGNGSMGGKHPSLNPYANSEYRDDKLLEMMIGNHVPIGWLTHKEVIKHLKEI